MKATIFMLLATTFALGGCKSLRKAAEMDGTTSLGKPYDLLVVCDPANWEGELGDTLRSVLLAPVEMLNQREPLFDVTRILPSNYKGMMIKQRNILRTVVAPTVKEPAMSVEYDLYAQPQIVVTLSGPDQAATARFLSENRQALVQVLHMAERDRTVSYAEQYYDRELNTLIRETFGVDMRLPKGYALRSKSEDFIWASQEYPTASKGVFLYSYPYTGVKDLSQESLEAARKRFASRIPGPTDGSYMTTSETIAPRFRAYRIGGRVWMELRGFWDVHGDFMGGPFVSFTTVDTVRERVFTIDGYVYSPKLHKRNFVRNIEQLVHLVHFDVPDSSPQAQAE